MDVKAAIATGAGHPLAVETVHLDGPRAGDTLLVADAAIMARSPHLYKRLPYELKKAIALDSQTFKVVVDGSRCPSTDRRFPMPGDSV